MWTSAHALVRRRAPHVVSTLAGSAAHRYSVRAQSTSSLPILAKVLQLLRFRLGCHTLPSAIGQPRNPRMPRDQRICTRCQHGLGDERHLVFECTKLQHIRDRYAHLFEGCDTMQLTRTYPFFGTWDLPSSRSICFRLSLLSMRSNTFWLGGDSTIPVFLPSLLSWCVMQQQKSAVYM